MTNLWYPRKESPMLGLTGLGGGVGSLMWYAPSGAGPYSLWVWGNNYQQGLGLNENHPQVQARSSPTQIPGEWNSVSTGGGDVGAAAIKSDGSLWIWGNATYGRLGLNQPDNSKVSSPHQVGTDTNWTAVSQNTRGYFGLKDDGTLWVWGSNGAGFLGLNQPTATQYSSPTQVGTSTDWENVMAAPGVRAVKTNGTMWSWGYNALGNLGHNNLTPYSSPKQLGWSSDWQRSAKTSGQNYSFLATKTDGSLWVCGYNGQGQLGQNQPTTVRYSSPIQVGAPYGSYNDVQAINSSGVQGAILNTTGTLITWGSGGYGQLGNESSSNQPDMGPSQIPGPWIGGTAQERSMHMIKDDGTHWAWGRNSEGELAVNNRTQYNSPVQVGTDTDWVDLGQMNHDGAQWGLRSL